jgi:hypothetical protein
LAGAAADVEDAEAGPRDGGGEAAGQGLPAAVGERVEVAALADEAVEIGAFALGGGLVAQAREPSPSGAAL